MITQKLRPGKDKVIIHNLERGITKTTSGIIIPDDDGTASGIRPRWAQVWKIGRKVLDVKIGDWVLLEHGRWSRHFNFNDGETLHRIHMIDFPEAVLLVTDNKPEWLNSNQKI